MKMSKNWYLESTWSCRNLQRELLLREAERGQRILDIGSGMGRTLGLLKKQKKSITGVDISKELLSDAKNIHKDIQYIRADGANLPFKEAAFDEVILEHVIEHVTNQKEVISETYRVLNGGGKLIVCTPTKYIYRFLAYLRKVRDLEFDRTWLKNPVPEHVAELPPSKLEKLLSNFKKVKVRGINPYVNTENPWMGIDLMAIAIK